MTGSAELGGQEAELARIADHVHGLNLFVGHGEDQDAGQFPAAEAEQDRLAGNRVGDQGGRRSPEVQQAPGHLDRAVDHAEVPAVAGAAVEVAPGAGGQHLEQPVQVAIGAGGDLGALLSVLAPDAWGDVDLGPGDPRARGVVHGAERVARNLLRFWGPRATLVSHPVGGAPALLGFIDRRLAGVLVFTMRGEKIQGVHVIGDPRQLSFLSSQLG